MTQDAPDTTAQPPAYLTTREVADLIRVKERKVYDLATAGEIPHRRVTGKLLFPAAEIARWIEGGDATSDAPRPPVLAGSHDPLLDWAVRESASGLATLFDGSTSGLDAFVEGRAALCGLHLPDDAGWNVGPVSRRNLRDCVLLGWAVRARGLLLRPGLADAVRSFADLAGRTVVMRQPGSGAEALFRHLLTRESFGPDAIRQAAGVARTESDAAAAVAAGEGDAAIGLEAMARQFGLAFLPLVSERFDLLVDRHAYFTEPVQALVRFSRSEIVAEKAQALGGYDLSEMGAVRWNAG
ncbi:helix-turn-helix transcriptional regulator [Sulfitobacter sp. D35]|uniref:helix-turn-helix transcriptional regulator n=1 Tax=Sulfitobacter sp. D35 TaxID=3083252 RepID=UPI00297002ED|nr:helix-turn-helix transcriptional regulator [Sulfitobacter sp. D35]MDW4497942.1 helix-turn-helix transcriptional regulator [Sulfitobacter sp. D35]